MTHLPAFRWRRSCVRLREVGGLCRLAGRTYACIIGLQRNIARVETKAYHIACNRSSRLDEPARVLIKCCITSHSSMAPDSIPNESWNTKPGVLGNVISFQMSWTPRCARLANVHHNEQQTYFTRRRHGARIWVAEHSPVLLHVDPLPVHLRQVSVVE